jgi:hypothetical protein
VECLLLALEDRAWVLYRLEPGMRARPCAATDEVSKRDTPRAAVWASAVICGLFGLRVRSWAPVDSGVGLWWRAMIEDPVPAPPGPGPRYLVVQGGVVRSDVARRLSLF